MSFRVGVSQSRVSDSESRELTIGATASRGRAPGAGATSGFWKDSVWVLLLTLLVRGVVIVWGASRFPPAADGQFYQVVANRIGQGLGYTWLWPDGVVTYAAHYPVGYPAILGILYAVFGSKPILAMLLNGFAGAVTTVSVHRMALQGANRWAAFGAGVVAALHPTLVFYTPAVMTELVSAALVTVAAAMAWALPRTRWGTATLLVGIGLLIGISTLVRPQQLLWAPLLSGWLVLRARQSDASGCTELCEPSNIVGDVNEAFQRKKTLKRTLRTITRVVLGASLVSVIAVGCCLPWTLRNCNKMERCVFVSANGGWSLLIGTSPLGHGAWTSIDSIGVPRECRLVFNEAHKDRCFGQAAKRLIAREPVAWVRLMPAKLAKTFDDVGAPGYYLNASNSAVFGDDGKWRLGAAEVVVQRLLAISAALALAFVRGPRKMARRGAAALAILATLVPFAWVGVLVFCVGVLLLGRRLFGEPALLFLAIAWAMTASVHAVFFGGARYAMVVVPFVIVAAARCWACPWAEDQMV